MVLAIWKRVFTLNTYMQLSSRSPGASGHETWLARYELLSSFFLCTMSSKDSQTSKSAIVHIEVLYTVVRQ